MKSILTFLVLILALVSSSITHAGWQEILEAQKHAHQTNTIIKIADPRIKAIQIRENNEDLLDLEDPKINPLESKILLMPLQETAAYGFYRAPHPHFGKVRVGLFQALKRLVEILPAQVGIWVYEAYRPLSVQQTYFDSVFNRIQSENPTLSPESIFNQTATLVSPVVNNVPPHSTGGAIDITLIHLETHTPLPMGKFGALQGHNPVAKTFSTDGLSQEEIDNRRLLYTAAAQAGLVNYPEEWWHYSVGDRYSSYFLELDYCNYGGL